MQILIIKQKCKKKKKVSKKKKNQWCLLQSLNVRKNWCSGSEQGEVVHSHHSCSSLVIEKVIKYIQVGREEEPHPADDLSAYLKYPKAYKN
jgi:hypothetical protein